MKEFEYDEIKFEIGGMLFTWDDEKEKINIKKHGIDFSSAAGVFLDDDAVYECNFLDENTGEERLDVIRNDNGKFNVRSLCRAFNVR